MGIWQTMMKFFAHRSRQTDIDPIERVEGIKKLDEDWLRWVDRQIEAAKLGRRRQNE